MPVVSTDTVTEPSDSVPEPTGVPPSEIVTSPSGLAVAGEVTLTRIETGSPGRAFALLATTVVSALATVSVNVFVESFSALLWANAAVMVCVPAPRVTSGRFSVAVPSDCDVGRAQRDRRPRRR